MNPALRTLFVYLASVALASAVSAAEDAVGHIQVRSEAGLTIALDNAHMGVTREDIGGLFIRDVTVGRHRLRVSRANQLISETLVTVAAGRVIVHDVPRLPRDLDADEEAAAADAKEVTPTGSLIIHSLPVTCEIDIPDLAVRRAQKSLDSWRLQKVPVGRYLVIARALDRTLTTHVDVVPGGDMAMLFDFEKETVSPMSRPQTGGGIGLAFVEVAAGTFTMGNENGRIYERPRKVTLSQGFLLGRTEVTLAQWRRVMGKDADPHGYHKGLSASRPVAVSWYGAMEFMERLNRLEADGEFLYRLPTEAEWERACGADPRTRTGDDLDAIAWYADTSKIGYRKTARSQLPLYAIHPVARKQASPAGFYDMVGSRREWCLDRCKKRSHKTGSIITGDKGSGKLVDPLGMRGELRIARGGNYRSPANACRSWTRAAFKPGEHAAGIRVVAVRKDTVELNGNGASGDSRPGK